VCVVGAERVHADTLEFVSEKLQPYGFAAEALMPAYGLAEAVVAVTGTPHAEAPRSLAVDSIALADGRVEEVAEEAPSATRIVSAGPPALGVELPGLEADRLGEIRVRAPTLADGYFGEPQLTAERFRDDAVLTGDLGFLRDGHLYPVGRLDDVISVGGRSVYTREIEAAVDSIGCARPGGIAVLETADAHRLALVLELNGGREDHDALAEQCAAIAMAKAGVALDECVFVRKARLPRTPSGKIQRHRARQLLASGRLQPARTVQLRAPAGVAR
jgi:fatty-acyl-CoA synthase